MTLDRSRYLGLKAERFEDRDRAERLLREDAPLLLAELDSQQARIDALTAENLRLREALRELVGWLDNNTTFYNVDANFDVEGMNIPVLAQVRKRIWYHATDDVESYPFSTVARRALEQEKREPTYPRHVCGESMEK